MAQIARLANMAHINLRHSTQSGLHMVDMKAGEPLAPACHQIEREEVDLKSYGSKERPFPQTIGEVAAGQLVNTGPA